MPNFDLTNEEAEDLTAFLMSQRKPIAKSTEQAPAALTRFASNKAKALLKSKLACQGCHRIGPEGGRIGPDLNSVGNRLQPDYIQAIIEKPQAIAPHSIMPRIPLTKKVSHLITSFLINQTNTTQSLPYLSPADHATVRHRSSTNITQLYLKNCAPCHGPRGNGDGFNAAFLTVRPSQHAQPNHSSKIPDDTLYDGIHSGGAVLNKSQLMPPWGQTLSPTQIRSLVKHIRDLCDCDGPSWSLPPKQP